MLYRIALVLFACTLTAFAAPSTIKFKTGTSFSAEVLQQTPSHLTVLFDYTVLSLRRSDIEAITLSKSVASPIANKRFPTWRQVIQSAASLQWASGLREIPATVIDVGVLRNIPYKSYRLGNDTFELNVYGDPDDPICFEVGIVNGTSAKREDQARCIALVCGLLGDTVDQKLVRLLDTNGDTITRRELTFETTPANAPDAYGGWWISAYFEDRLDSERASDEAVTALSQPAAPAPKTPTTSPKPAQNAEATVATPAWDNEDLKYARKPTVISTNTSSSRVYVRGYFRKDGTYVRPHTRRR